MNQFFVAMSLLFIVSCGRTEVTEEFYGSNPLGSVAEGLFSVELEEGYEPANLKKDVMRISDLYECQTDSVKRVEWSAKALALPSSLYNRVEVRFDGCGFSKDEMRDVSVRLKNIPGVKTSKAMNTIQLNALPYSETSEFSFTGTRPWQFDAVNAGKTCEVYGGDSYEVVVAVIDTGVDLDHPDLQDVLYRDGDGHVIGQNFVRNPYTGKVDPLDFSDKEDHGTHVAGLIAGAFNEAEKTAGIARCASVKIMPIRILNAEGSGTDKDAEKAIIWALNNGADIINMSLGYSEVVSGGEMLNSAVYDMAYTQRVAVFAASGNSGAKNGTAARINHLDEDGHLLDVDYGPSYHFPSSFRGAIGVAAFAQDGGLSNISNYGFAVDVAAPGENVKATVPGPSWGVKTGTSMATGVMSGVYALSLAKARVKFPKNLKRIPIEQLKMHMKNSVRVVSVEEEKVASGGIIDAYNLTNILATNYSADSIFTPIAGGYEASPNEADLSFRESADMTFHIAGMENGDVYTSSYIELASLPIGTKKIKLYWSHENYPFGSIEVDPNTGNSYSVVSNDKWSLKGEGYLRAIAINADSHELGRTQVYLRTQ